MIVRDIRGCEEIESIDKAILRELLHPLRDKIRIRYSVAHARVRSGEETLLHRLRNSSEVYYILEGRGEMYIDGETQEVSPGQIIYIPPNSVQRIRNIGESDLVFLCIVDPAWREENEELVE